MFGWRGHWSKVGPPDRAKATPGRRVLDFVATKHEAGVMKQQVNDWIRHNRVFGWIATATAVLLLVPLAAMQVTPAVDWDAMDFVVMAVLLFGTASLFVLVARRAPRKRRLIIGGMFLLAFLYAWAELAVGVFTDLGN